MDIKQSVCSYCSVGCNLNFYVENNEIKRVEPTSDYPVNNGFCCIKGLNLDKQQTKHEPHKKPLLRNEKGEMGEIPWDKAFKTFATRMKEIQERYGKESVAFLSTGQITTEEVALLGFVGRIHMGINGDGNTRLCMATSIVAHKQSFGFDAPPYTLKDLELSDTIIFIGANPVIAHPIAWDRVKGNKDAKVITIDPRKSETVLNSDIWIDIKPKSDIVLLYTLANVLIENEWIDKDYIKNYSEGFDGFKNHVKKYTLENVEEQTGISIKRVLELAEMIHKGKRVSFWWTMGVNQGFQAVRTAQAIINLAVITGNIGREGTGANSLTGQSNAMGSRMYSNTTTLYAGRDYNNENHREYVANILDIEEDKIPTKPTIPYDEIIKRIKSGEIKALWVVGTNPADSWVNNKEFKEVVKNLEFFVVQDLYSDTDSAKLCDLCLPSVSSLKKEGFLINTERRLSAVVPILSKEEGELTDYEIFLGIGRALGVGKALDKWKTPKHAFEIIKQFSSGMPCDITGVDYDMLVNSTGVQWPFREGDKLEDNERRLYEDNRFFTESGKIRFVYEDVVDYPEIPRPEFPYILNSGRGTVGQWHTQTRTREIPTVEDITFLSSHVFMNSELARDLNIKDNEKVLITSSNGESANFIAKISDSVKKNQLFAPMHYFNTNILTPYVFDTYSKEPSYKYVTVNIQRI
ncbi:nitrate reductase NarB [Clostridium cylindrosporum DSM 605]|uniref:Nitrate reductase NarB n=1 Tax=Clostridium cylindrosporum DSM 605 TaxID=1121307 RepID=A0A0J8D7W8_CLOCY|nr:molybdopterin oxidoreductase family protein [Clostridium cylindrosporum]KMT22140.1 nitrate reductase NarB [Clostridium cylindrosporum DSM 605]